MIFRVKKATYDALSDDAKAALAGCDPDLQLGDPGEFKDNVTGDDFYVWADHRFQPHHIGRLLAMASNETALAKFKAPRLPATPDDPNPGIDYAAMRSQIDTTFKPKLDHKPTPNQPSRMSDDIKNNRATGAPAWAEDKLDDIRFSPVQPKGA